MDEVDRRLRPDDVTVRRDAIKLVEYAKETAVSSRSVVLDVKDFPECWWLSDLSEELRFRATPASNDSLLEVPYRNLPSAPVVPEPLRDCLDKRVWSDPDVSNAAVGEQLSAAIEGGKVRKTTLDRALAMRQKWIDDVEEVGPYRKFYEELREAAQELATQDDEYELVLCAGLFVGIDLNTKVIRRHLLVKRCWARVDKKTSAVLVGVDTDVPMQLEDRRFLVEVFGERLQLAAGLREEIAESSLLPHAPDEPARWLADWSERMLVSGPPYSAAMAPPSRETTATSVTAAPALILRRRDRSGVVTFFEGVLEHLRSGRAGVPLGLFQLLHTLDEDHQRMWLSTFGSTLRDKLLSDDPLFHKETNAEQRQVLDRVRRFNGAVVQGPPGTGKTHTIANLLGAMLADGLRVLVVSQREQPLRVLRDKLPADMQPLCVSMTSKRSGGSGVEASARDMSARLSRINGDPTGADVEKLDTQRRTVQNRVAVLEDELAQLLHAEHLEHPEIAPGYAGLLARIAERVVDGCDRFAWFPALPSGAPIQCPLSPPQMHELLALARGNPDGPVRAGQFVPDTESTPTVDAVADALRTMAPRDVESDRFSDRLAAVPQDVLTAWRDAARHVTKLSAYLYQGAAERFPVIGSGVDGILSGDHVDVWADVLSCHGQATELERRLRAPELRHLQATAQTPQEWSDFYAQAEMFRQQAKSLKDGLERAAPLRNKVFKTPTALGKATSGVRKAFTFQAAEPTTFEAAKAAAEYLDVMVESQWLDHMWNFVSAPADWPFDASERLRLRKMIDPHLLRLRDLAELSVQVRDSVATQALLVVLSNLDTWHEFANEADAALERRQADNVRRIYAEWISRWKTYAEQSDSAPENAGLVKALESGDLDAYRAAYDDLAAARTAIAKHARHRDLLNTLTQAHAPLAREMVDTCAESEWAGRSDEIDNAWSWAAANRFLHDTHQPGLVAKREAELVAQKAQLRKITGELATELAWNHCLDRMTPKQQRDLKTFAVLTQKRGGNYAADYRRAAKAAMQAARVAVPAWVMPIPKVAELIPPEPNSFDAVIVDEASQAAMTSIFLLWLAPRIIVVGDDKQCAPQSSTQNLSKIQQRLHADFPDIAEHVRILLLPNSNLYNILDCAFPNGVTLTEHFRCMPEIIGWPSHQFYDDRLVPLRQYGVDRLEPVVIEQVDGGQAIGKAENMINRPEAEHIVSVLATCIADPAYDRKTFGVIALRSRAQRRHIQHLLLQRIPAEEIDRRDIVVGSAAEFQGDERDVMIVSTVASGHTRQMLKDVRYHRDLNVAVSRARDQLRVITSLTDDELDPDDIRRKMIAHYRKKPNLGVRPVPDEFPEDALRPPFTSLFPQRVYRALLERGYRAHPNVTVGRRQLDIVVYGESSAVAIICDYYTGVRTEDLERETESLRELQRAGWPFHRIADSQFVLDRAVALTPLWRALDQHGVRPGEILEV